MAKTLQKRVKFSKGEINSLLNDRTDLNILDESANYIKNYISSIFGSIKTRAGTKVLHLFQNIITNIENPTIESLIGNDTTNIFNKDNIFISNLLENKKEFFNITAKDVANEFSRFNIHNIYFDKSTNAEISFTTEEIPDTTDETETPSEEEEASTPVYRIANITITNKGNGYRTPPTITFTIENFNTELETLPTATAIINDKGEIESITITNSGIFLNPNKLTINIDKPPEFEETLYLQGFNQVNESWEDKANFVVNQESKNINIKIEERISKARIVRKTEYNLNTKLNLSYFSFNIEKPTVENRIGGITDLLFDINKKYLSDPILNKNQILMYFKFEDTVDCFRINGIKLKSSETASFALNIQSPNIWTKVLSSIFINSSGYGYDGNKTNYLEFGGTWINSNATEFHKPTATAIVNNKGEVIGVNIIDRGGNHIANPSVSLPNNNQWKINLILQGKNEETNEWIDLYTFEVNEKEELNINANIGNSYREFRLYRTDNETVYSQLYINNIVYGNKGFYSKNVKILPFVFNNEFNYLVALSDSFISIFENDTLIVSLQATSIKKEYLERIKYTQAENIMILTHPEMKPQVLERLEDGWSFYELEIKNIPKYAFGGEKIKKITNIQLTPSSEEGSISITAGTNFFNENSIGQIIDGNGGRFRITEYVNANKVYGYTIIPFYTKDAFSTFDYIDNYENVWSESRGYPNSCLFYQQRLWFGGSKSRPLTLWGSRINQYSDFRNVNNNDNDSINIDIDSKENNEIVNLYGNRGLQIFSGGAEFVAGENSLTPNNIFITQVSNIGNNKNINPHNLAGTTIFIDKKGLNLNAFVYNYEQSSYNTNTLTLLNNQIIKNPVSLAVDYNSDFEDGNYVYMVNKDGTIALANILLDQNINSFTRFETNYGKILDCVVLNNRTYFTVLRNDKIYLEKLDNNLKTDFTIKTNIINNKIDNLYDYENMEVRVYNNKMDYGTYLVKNGFISNISSLEEEHEQTNSVNLGIDIKCKLISNNISVGGQTNNIKSRISKAVITTNNTNKINFNNHIIKSKDNIFCDYACSNWAVENKFFIESVFDYLEIKSIVLYINYGN